MSEQERVSDLLRRVHEGDAWHGPSLREALAGVDAAKASARPIPGAHSIWEIALHISGWADVVRRRLSGEAVSDPEEGDFPAIEDTSEEAWQAALSRLDERVAGLRAAIAEIEDSSLEGTVRGGKAPHYATLHGVLHHHVYHTGQIAALEKAS
jgi:uncharacterized damage-inducible protein DinB